MTWYYADGGRQVGPIDESALDELFRQGVVRDDTLVWREGMPNWQPHASVRGLRPPPPPAPAVEPGSAYCSECGRPFPASQLSAIGAASVCSQCKPIYVQRTQGVPAAASRHYGGFWIRFVAVVIDVIILAAVGFVIRLPLATMIGFGAITSGDIRPALPMLIGATGLLILIQVALQAAYEIYFVATRGATPGKMVLGLKVVRSDGSPVSTGVAVGRYFAKWLSYIIFCIGYIIAGFDPQKRALHDHICDTRVVYTR